MPSIRSTHPRLVTEPTMKPTLAPPRHSRTPTWTSCIGCCAWAPASDATSMGAARPARMTKRRMKKSPADECDASRETGKRHSPGACLSMAQHPWPCQIRPPSVSSFRDGPKDQTRNLEIPGSRCARPGMTFALVKKRPASRGPLSNQRCVASAVMVMPVMMMARTEPDRLQFDPGDAGRDVQPGLALHADRLQRVGIVRAGDQKIAAAADPDRRIGADAAVIAREIAAPDAAVRRIHRPGKSRLIGNTKIEPEAAHGCDIGLGSAAFALEHTFKAGDRADQEADILTALALQYTCANRRQCIGARERRHARHGGKTECRESH